VKRRLIPWSPAAACTPPAETNEPGEAWSPAEAAAFLAHVRDDRYYAAWRLVLTTGARRGELAGARWTDLNLDTGSWWLSNSRVAIGGTIVEKAPKSKRPRMVALDHLTVDVLRAHRVTQARELLALGIPDPGYVLTSEIGEPVKPNFLTDRWTKLVASSGLPVRTLHEGRHTAVTIGRVHAGVDAATMRERVGHASEHVADRYTHPHADVSRAAAERIANVIDGGQPAPAADAQARW
jgi:integrase